MVLQKYIINCTTTVTKFGAAIDLSRDSNQCRLHMSQFRILFPFNISRGKNEFFFITYSQNLRILALFNSQISRG